MRRLILDLGSIGGRRSGSNASALKYRTQRTFQQQRKHSTESSSNANTNTNSNNNNITKHLDSKTTTPPGTTASSAGAPIPPLTTTTTITTTAGPRNRSVLEAIKAGPLGRFGSWYSRTQDRRPYVTQMASSFVIYLCGDLGAQLLFPSEAKPADDTAGGGDDNDKDKKPVMVGYDPLRTLRHLTIGLTTSIPQYKWFMFLHHNFNYSSKALSIFTKVCVQQAVFAPVFNSYFFSVQSLLVGDSIDETWQRLKRALPSSLWNSVKLWPAVVTFSFLYVPPQFRSVFGGVIAIGWQTYLSWLNQRAAREVAAREAEAAAMAVAGGLDAVPIASPAV